MNDFFSSIPWNVVCPDVRVYTTHYALEDCIGLLDRKNVYDTFEYKFYWDNAYFILFDEPLIPRTLDLRFCKGSVFELEFEQQENRTRFVVRFHHVEGQANGIPYISQSHLDQFFRIKLDAKPWWPEY